MAEPVCIRCGGALVDGGVFCPMCRAREDAAIAVVLARPQCTAPDFPTMLGSYRHHKGGTYTLLHIARDSSNNSGRPDQPLAVYVSHQRRTVRVRELDEFLEPVVWPDGVTRPRFDLMPDETPEAP